MNDLGEALFDAPEPTDRFVALGLAFAISMIVAIAAPFAAVPLVRIAPFIPLYESAVIINDLATAAVFTALFIARGARGLLLLAAGYLWTALLAAAHLLSFPGLFPGLLPTGPQTTAWLYYGWHVGFPTAVLLYATSGGAFVANRRRVLNLAALGVVAAVALVIVLCTAGHDLLPPVMKGDYELPLANLGAGGICLLAVLAIGLLLRRHSGQTRLDLWLAVAIYAWIGDVALSAVFNAGRFDLGFYAGRFFGFLAVSFVLYQVLLLAVVEHYRHARR
jgi:hypothetical protein